VKPTKIAYAVAAVLNASIASAATAAESDSIVSASSGVLGEVVVTAQRREESIQNVPITMQALTSETLMQLNATTLDDFVKYLPAVSTASNGPGQTNVYIRGLSIGSGGTQGSGAIGTFPNVAVYLDEQSEQLPGRNLDIYAVDLERIEVLEGPQGTLFGGGAEAGVLRYITNKPKLNVTEGSVNAGYGTTAHGDPNSNVNFTLNLPVIGDVLAVRGVFFQDRRGGYINNVGSLFTRMGTDLGLAERNGGTVSNTGQVITPGQVPVDSEVINNYQIAGNAINPLTYTGFRVGAFAKFNDNWDALLTQSYQNMDAEGVFYQNPNGSEGNPLPPLSVTVFNPSYVKDRFENTALTVNGKVGGLKLVYSGAYMVRNVDQQQDYTNYARGVWATYYQCTGYSTGFDPPTKCYTPSATWHDRDRNTHESHELRISTPDDKRIRGLAGLYYEDFRIYDQMDYQYRSLPTCTPAQPTECFLNVEPWPGVPANNPNVRNPDDPFFDDVQRGYKQKAVFGSVDFDLIPHTLTFTAGTRYFKYDEKEAGGDVGSFYCKFYDGAVPNSFGPCSITNYNGYGSGGPFGTNLDLQVPNRATPHGFKSRANLTWHITDDAMVYYTWSQGFRPGGFNRGTSSHLPDANGVPQFITPAVWQPDNLTNNEFGWKTEWLDHRVLFNGSIYQENWDDVQTGFDDPQGGLGSLAFFSNGPSYRIRGVEPTLIWRVTHGLTLQAAASWNSSSQTNSPYLVNDNPASPGFGQKITSIPNPYGPLGSPLANAPPFQGNVRLRYEWSFNGYDAFVQLAGQHTDHSYTNSGYVESYVLPAYSTADASLGLSKGNWYVEAYGQNLTDSNAYLNKNDAQFVVTEVPLRPRVLGIKAGYKFSDR
jgi:outer membrane receptor protein involved in Fe transport